MEKITTILALIDEYNLADAFAQIDEMGATDPVYARLKKEFISGKTDVDFTDRFKLWVRSELNKPATEANTATAETTVITKNITVPADGSDFGFSQTLVSNDGFLKMMQEKFKPKKILFICSGPKDTYLLDFGKEFKKIKDALQSSEKREQFEIEIETGVEADDFLRLVTRFEPDFLHISTHASETQGLYFEGSQGEQQIVSPTELAELFDLIQQKNKPELVVLSACNSLSQAQAIQGYVGRVVGMQGFLPEQAGVVYAEKLYEMIFDGQDIDYAHKSAQMGLKMAKIPTEGVVATHEIPVLLAVMTAAGDSWEMR
jgi:hypothetical protein